MARLRVAIALATCLLGLGPAAAGPRLDAAAALERSEAAIGGLVDDVALLDTEGRPFRLAELRGRPLVVSLVYTSCSSVCPTTTQTLRSAVSRARDALGDDSFGVLTVGFDARFDTPGRMAAFGRDQSIEQDPAWQLASGDKASIAALLDDLGFSYEAAAGGFEHVTQTTILDAEGRVFRHVYGDSFPIPVFIEPLKGLVFGTSVRSFTVSALADRVRFLCTVYDPMTGRYRTDFAIAFGIGIGGISLLLTGWVVLRLWRGNRPVGTAHG